MRYSKANLFFFFFASRDMRYGDSKVRDDRGTRLYEFGLIAGFIED